MNTSEIIIGLLIIIAVIAVTVVILRWVFRIDYICARLFAISSNLLAIKECLDKEQQQKDQSETADN